MTTVYLIEDEIFIDDIYVPFPSSELSSGNEKDQQEAEKDGEGPDVFIPGETERRNEEEIKGETSKSQIDQGHAGV